MTFACAIFDVKTDQFYPLFFRPAKGSKQPYDYNTTYEPEIINTPFAYASDVLEQLKPQLDNKRVLDDSFLWGFDVLAEGGLNFTASHANYLGGIRSGYVLLEGPVPGAQWVHTDYQKQFLAIPKAIGILASDPSGALTPMVFTLQYDHVKGLAVKEYAFASKPDLQTFSQQEGIDALLASPTPPERIYATQTLPVLPNGDLTQLRVLVRDFNAYVPIEIIARATLNGARSIFNGRRTTFTP